MSVLELQIMPDLKTRCNSRLQNSTMLHGRPGKDESRAPIVLLRHTARKVAKRSNLFVYIRIQKGGRDERYARSPLVWTPQIRAIPFKQAAFSSWLIYFAFVKTTLGKCVQVYSCYSRKASLVIPNLVEMAAMA